MTVPGYSFEPERMSTQHSLKNEGYKDSVVVNPIQSSILNIHSLIHWLSFWFLIINGYKYEKCIKVLQKSYIYNI